MSREYDKLHEHYINNYEKYISDADITLEDSVIQLGDSLNSKDGISLINYNNIAQDVSLKNIKVENSNEQLSNVTDNNKQCELGLKGIGTIKVETCANNENIARLQKKEFHLKGNPMHSRINDNINSYERYNSDVDIKLEDFTVQTGDFLDSKAGIPLISDNNVAQDFLLETIKVEDLNEQLNKVMGNTEECEFQLQEIESVKCVQNGNAQVLHGDPLSEELSSKENPTYSILRKDNGAIFCKKCNKTFPYKYYYKFHIRAHPGKTPCICDICEKVFVKPCLLKRHIVAHSESRPYSCKICRKRFKRQNAVRQHQRIHFYSKRFPCDQCDKSFQSDSKLEAHKVSHKIDETVSHILYSTA